MPEIFNSNSLHNVLNILITLSALAVAVLLATGCTQLGDGTLECTRSFVAPDVAACAIAGLGALKILINIVRDGLSGLTKPQPPVGS
jgi:hypothetical protein